MSEYTAKAISPLNGRYYKIGEQLEDYFSEYALVRNRVYVEIEWLKFLLSQKKIELKSLSEEEREFFANIINEIIDKFDINSFNIIKKIEEETHHDVKAVEYFIDEELDKMGVGQLKSLVHIGCTSEDINNVAYALMIKNGLNNVWLKQAQELVQNIEELAIKYADTPMLAHTHGQPATPTTIGKEFKVYFYRLTESIENIKQIKIKAKFNGATGNYSAISIAFSELDWEKLSKEFIEKNIGVYFNPLTTQIENHDYICHILDGIRHFNNVVSDFDVDMWLYISMEYFKQMKVEKEVGSSTMPHKVNPIRFENSESNVDMSNSICVGLSNKLPKSRLQRDLSDSSSLRNLGLAFGYSVQAISETIAGLKKCIVNNTKLEQDLNDKWEVLAEAIQTMLRKYGIPDAYEQLKELTRGKTIQESDIHSFIETITCLSDIDKQILLDLSPSKYIGYSKKLALK